MGFLDRVKGAMSQMTGGAGNMQLQIEGFSFQRGQPLNFSAVLNATGPLKGKSVNVEITGVEQVKYEELVQRTTSSGPADTRYEQRTKTNQTYHYTQPVDPNPVQMNEGESRQFNGSIQIPPQAQPTYQGIDCTHTWKVRIFLDVAMGADIADEREILVV